MKKEITRRIIKELESIKNALVSLLSLMKDINDREYRKKEE
jgi:hypothetical protein